MSEHIKHIFEERELQEEAVVRKFRTTAARCRQSVALGGGVEHDYLNAIKRLEDRGKKGNNEEQ